MRSVRRSVRHFKKCQALRGQSTIETALLLGAVAVGLVVLFSFLRNSVASRLKTGSDAFGHGLQYDGKLGQTK